MSKVPTIRTSERIAFKRCQWKWYQSWRQGLTPKRTGDALAFGTWVHVALGEWYCGPGMKRGPHPAETFRTVAGDALRYVKTKDATEESEAKYTDMVELGTVLLEEYVNRYGNDERWLIVSPEQTFSFSIPFPRWWRFRQDREILARYVGTFDLIYRDAATGLLWLGEHKTAKTVSTGHLALDEQAGTYWAMAERGLRREGLIRRGERLHGINYNFLRKALPDPRPEDDKGYKLNKNGERSKVQPKPLFVRYPVHRTNNERRHQLLRVQDDAAQIELARTGTVPLAKTPHWSCERWCEFFEMCRLHETGGDWRALRESLYDRRDPYADHRKSTDETPSFEFG